MLDTLLDAFAGVPGEYIEEAARAMGYLPGRRKKPVIRYLLIAAVLTALLAASAVAANLYGRAQRLAQMPDSPQGETRVALIPNGFQGSPTYLGSAEWWAFDAQWQDTHDTLNQNYDLEFTKGDLEKYQICGLYSAYDEQQADKLYEIAEKYDLKLYKEVIHCDEYGGAEFFSLTGCEPFAENMEESRFAGYVFDDGSFKLETDFRVDGEEVWATVTRIRSGSIYPYGGAWTDRFQHEETEYLTKKGQTVLIDIPVSSGLNTRATVDYVTPDGKTWISVCLWTMEEAEKDWLQEAKNLADTVDFEAMSVRNEGAKQILDVPTAAEDNRSTAEKLESFRSSKAVQANEEFSAFFRENFYGTSFTGTYGMEGYSDIDDQLRTLGEKYGLTYAKQKSTGNAFYPNAVVYDNGAWQAQFPIDRWSSKALIHYIPKDALYTAWVPPLEISQYRRLWDYEVEDGLTLSCYSEGPSVIYGAGAVLETDQAYILLTISGTVPKDLQQAADLVDWAGLVKGEPSK